MQKIMYSSDRNGSLAGDLKSPPWRADISAENREVLLQISAFIRLAEGFRLGLVKCNQPVQRRQMADLLKEMLVGEVQIQEVDLKEPVDDLRAAVGQLLTEGGQTGTGKRVLMVFGFEQSIPSEGSVPALEGLNLSRDLFPCDFPFPFLLWLPDYALTRLAREAPDFWGWRSGVFEFVPDRMLMTTMESATITGMYPEGLSLEKKKERLASLEGLVWDYSEMKRGERENRSYAAVLDRLAYLRFQLGDYPESRRLYNESLKIWQDLGERSGEARTLHNLGSLAKASNDYPEARRLYNESLKIWQDLGERSGEARTLHALGSLAEASGDYPEARRLYNESLKISQDQGDRRGEARTLRDLAMLAQASGDYLEARRLFNESLKIRQELVDRSGVFQTLHALGSLAEASGGYPEARRLYNESLKISQDLGERSDEARTLHNLGSLAQASGDCSEARRLYNESLKIFQDLGERRGEALSLTKLASLEEEQNDIKAAIDHITQAEAIFKLLGAGHHAEEARIQKERLGRRLGRPS
ncbi:tetratricopeptide repeat protein [Methanothrix sp.]|uniref:tetratricopeptide repeat protein n=1 Tax=Methanothrix sp. TaxID=90426 RepID=UPI003BAFF1F2